MREWNPADLEASLDRATAEGPGPTVAGILLEHTLPRAFAGRSPLENIRATTDIMCVMKGSILYEADTLNEIWPETRPYGPYYWVDEAALRADDRAVDAWRR